MEQDIIQIMRQLAEERRRKETNPIPLPPKGRLCYPKCFGCGKTVVRGIPESHGRNCPNRNNQE